MLLKDYIDNLLARVNALLIVDGVEIQESSKLDILVRVESLISCKYLLGKIRDCLGADTLRVTEANASSLNPLIECLAGRWSRVRLTDASYCHTPQSLASVAYLLVATEIAAITGKKPYDYLMPTVDASLYITSKGTLHDLKLHEFIFADGSYPRTSGLLASTSSTKDLTYNELIQCDVGEPIEVLACLQNAASDSRRILHTTCKEKKVKLNEADEERVSQHSAKWAFPYYIGIKASADTSELEVKLKDALNGDGYEVKSSYGAEGKRRLFKVIMSMCCSDRESLANLLAKVIPKNDWSAFLDCFKMMMPLSQIKELFQFTISLDDHRLYFPSNDYNAALLYSFTYWYKLDRESKPDFTTSYAPTLTCYMPTLVMKAYNGFNRSEKLAAADVLLQYLSGKRDKSLVDFQDTVSLPLGVTKERRAAALKDGRLGEIFDATEKKAVPVAAVPSLI